MTMNAYLEGDLETLKKHVSSELVEAKVFDGSPMIIVSFKNMDKMSLPFTDPISPVIQT